MVRLRHLVSEVDGLFRINANETELLRYHAFDRPFVGRAAECPSR